MGPSPHGPAGSAPVGLDRDGRVHRGTAPPCTGTEAALDPLIATITLGLVIALIGALAGTAGFAALVVRRQNRRVAALAEHLTQAQDEGALIALDANRIRDPRLRDAFAALADRVADTWRLATVDPLTRRRQPPGDPGPRRRGARPGGPLPASAVGDPARPRPLQAAQRLPRPRGRRPGAPPRRRAARGRTSAPIDIGRPLRRRGVPDRPPRDRRRRRRLRRREAAPDRRQQPGPARPTASRRHGHALRRRRRRARRGAPARRPRPRRRRRAVLGQGPRPRPGLRVPRDRRRRHDPPRADRGRGAQPGRSTSAARRWSPPRRPCCRTLRRPAELGRQAVDADRRGVRRPRARDRPARAASSSGSARRACSTTSASSRSPTRSWPSRATSPPPSGGSSPSTPRSARSSSSRRARCATRRRSCSTTTSGTTAAATPTASPARRSPSGRGSCRSSTRTRR